MPIEVVQTWKGGGEERQPQDHDDSSSSRNEYRLVRIYGKIRSGISPQQQHDHYHNDDEESHPQHEGDNHYEFVKNKKQDEEEKEEPTTTYNNSPSSSTSTTTNSSSFPPPPPCPGNHHDDQHQQQRTMVEEYLLVEEAVDLLIQQWPLKPAAADDDDHHHRNNNNSNNNPSLLLSNHTTNNTAFAAAAATTGADHADEYRDVTSTNSSSKNSSSTSTTSPRWIYRDKIVPASSSPAPYPEEGSSSSALSSCCLPCSFLLLNSNGHCVGHGRLTDCFETSGGCAAAATYIVIRSIDRGQGLGRILMTLLEQQAILMGYHYIYLWTHTAIDFYQKLNYTITHRVSLQRACIKKWNEEQISKLEHVLLSKTLQMQRLLISDNNNNTKITTKADEVLHRPPRIVSQTRETILLPPPSQDDIHNNNSSSNDPSISRDQDVWLRKRLVESVGSILIPLDDRLEEVRSAINTHLGEWEKRIPHDVTTSSSVEYTWIYQLVQIPWQQQVGPSCGLAALRMIREQYQLIRDVENNDSNSHGNEIHHQVSLLSAAQEAGYSQDGEMFNIDHLVDLAQSICNLSCIKKSMTNTSIQDVYEVLSCGGTIIFPYDSLPISRLPGRTNGYNAHYGIIVGMVLGYYNHNPQKITDNNEKTPQLFHGPSCFTDISVVPNNPMTPKIKLLVVQHSLSHKWVIAPWDIFLESNQQLTSFDKAKYHVKFMNLQDQSIHFHIPREC